MTEEEHMTKQEGWIHNKWRPAIGWLYALVILCDFVLFPIAYSFLQVFTALNGGTYEQWAPLTLRGGGLFHVSMLTIVGVTAFGRTQEKLSKLLKQTKVDNVRD